MHADGRKAGVASARYVCVRGEDKGRRVEEDIRIKQGRRQKAKSANRTEVLNDSGNERGIHNVRRRKVCAYTVHGAESAADIGAEGGTAGSILL